MYYKNLAKHAKGRQTTPILNTIRVKDGIATSTDLDFYIHVPVEGFDFEDGDEDLTYHAHGFDKGIFVKSESPATDFPDLKEKGDVIGRTVLKAEHLDAFKWVMLAQSKEETRYYLNGVYFDKDTIVATDGHRLHSFAHDIQWGRDEPPKKKRLTKSRKKAAPAEEPKPEVVTGCILPKKACALMIELMKETKAKECSIAFHDNLTFTINIGEAVLEGKLIDGTFPAWRRVVPKDENLKGKTVLNCTEIKTVVPNIEVMTRISAGARTRASIAIENGKLRPALIIPSISEGHEWNVSCKIPFKAGFNLKYLIDVGSGVLEYTDAASPVKISDRRGGVDRMAVLMPLRV